MFIVETAASSSTELQLFSAVDEAGAWSLFAGKWTFESVPNAVLDWFDFFECLSLGRPRLLVKAQVDAF
jgi:hypothetical protein